VAFRGDNRAFGGSQTDLLPDDINSFIEYDLAGDNTGDVTSNALTTPITVDALVTDWAGVTRFGVDPSEAPDTSSAMDLRNVAMSHDATSVNILYDMYNPIEGTNSGGRFLSWGWQTYLDTDQDTSTGYRVSSIGVDYLVEGYAVSRYTGDGTSLPSSLSLEA